MPRQSTPLGALVRFLGSIQLAVPVLTLAAGGMAYGTYLESTVDARAARSAVYGAPWFIALMVLVCVSLVMAAVTRWPWRRKHVGFLVVHASLVALIAGGFWSLFGRVEGRVTLGEGSASFTLETAEETVELVEHDAGSFRILGGVPAPAGPGRVRVGGVDVDVAEVWENTAETVEVLDGGPEPYRAVRIQLGPVEESAVWIGDEAKGEAPVIDGVRVRVLAADRPWEPPSARQSERAGGYVFLAGDREIPLGAEGDEAVPGWRIASVRRFTHASVSAGSISDDAGKQANPAIDVTITDGRGTVERHTAFELFPDMMMSKTLEGPARSGARLRSTGVGHPDLGVDTLVVHGVPPGLRLSLVTGDGRTTTLSHDGPLPFVADFGARRFNITGQYTHAWEKSSFVRAPRGKDVRPALLVRVGGAGAPLAWKGMVPVEVEGRPCLLRYGPRTVRLPFLLTLDQFRKTDYPGTDMAMAYESDVTVSAEGAPNERATISMNSPLARDGWKVYQSGFVGSDVSVFSVMRDPGLPLTYLSCVTLCLGILITFYGRGLSWGHPGIPVPFSGKEQPHAAASASLDPPSHVRDPDRAASPDARHADPAGGPGGPPAGGAAGDGLAGEAGGHAGARRRAGDAAGYVRV